MKIGRFSEKTVPRYLAWEKNQARLGDLVVNIRKCPDLPLQALGIVTGFSADGVRIDFRGFGTFCSFRGDIRRVGPGRPVEEAL